MGRTVSTEDLFGTPAPESKPDFRESPEGKKVFSTKALFGEEAPPASKNVVSTGDLFGQGAQLSSFDAKNPEASNIKANDLENLVWKHWSGIPEQFITEAKQRDRDPTGRIFSAILGPASALIPGKAGQHARDSFILGMAPIAEVFNRFIERPIASQVVPLARHLYFGEPMPEGDVPKIIQDYAPALADRQVWGALRNLLQAYFTVKPQEFEDIKGYSLTKGERPEFGDIFAARNIAMGIDPKIGKPLAAMGGLALRSLMPDSIIGGKAVLKKTPGAIKTTADVLKEAGQTAGTVISETAKEIPGAIKTGVAEAGKAVSGTVRGGLQSVANNVQEAYGFFKGTTDKQTFIKQMMSEKGLAKHEAQQLYNVFKDFIKSNAPETSLTPEYATKALFGTDRPGIMLQAEKKVEPANMSAEVDAVRSQVKKLEDAAKVMTESGQEVPKPFLENIEKLKASIPTIGKKPAKAESDTPDVAEEGKAFVITTDNEPFEDRPGVKDRILFKHKKDAEKYMERHGDEAVSPIQYEDYNPKKSVRRNTYDLKDAEDRKEEEAQAKAEIESEKIEKKIESVKGKKSKTAIVQREKLNQEREELDELAPKEETREFEITLDSGEKVRVAYTKNWMGRKGDDQFEFHGPATSNTAYHNDFNTVPDGMTPEEAAKVIGEKFAKDYEKEAEKSLKKTDFNWEQKKETVAINADDENFNIKTNKSKAVVISKAEYGKQDTPYKKMIYVHNLLIKKLGRGDAMGQGDRAHAYIQAIENLISPKKAQKTTSTKAKKEAGDEPSEAKKRIGEAVMKFAEEQASKKAPEDKIKYLLGLKSTNEKELARLKKESDKRADMGEVFEIDHEIKLLEEQLSGIDKSIDAAKRVASLKSDFGKQQVETFKKELIEKGINEQAAQRGAEALVQALVDKEAAKKILYPENKRYREIWMRETGEKLPNTLSGTIMAINDYFSPVKKSEEPSYKVKTAELRPYRQADGSIGYEAIPIIESQEKSSKVEKDDILKLGENPNETGREKPEEGRSEKQDRGASSREAVGESSVPADQSVDNAGDGDVSGEGVLERGPAQGTGESGRGISEEIRKRGIPESAGPREYEGNYLITEADKLGAGSVKQKFKDNLSAIKLLKQIESEGRLATKEEQSVLVKYVGWGGLAQAFDPKNEQWAKDFESLKNVLTEKEYLEARASTTNAHYTSREIISAMWDAVKQFGFKRGRVLEPGMGTGNFLGLRPAGGKLSFTGVELDGLTGRIAKQLYQDADIHISGFEDVNLSQNYYDLAISNVPFANTKPVDRRAKELGIPSSLSLHDFFFAKSLALVRPGGLIAFVTSRYTLDKQENSFRKFIASKADFIGAIRLPRTAFKANAGTEVVTDIIFLRKRMEGEVDTGKQWVESKLDDIGGTDFHVNEYLANNPSMILGEEAAASGLYSKKEYTVKATEGELSEKLKTAIESLPKNLMESSSSAVEKIKEETKLKELLPSHLKEDSYFEKDGKIYQKLNDNEANLVEFGQDTPRVKSIIEIRDSLKQALYDQRADASEEKIAQDQKELNTIYDKFVKKYGRLSDSKNQSVFENDPEVHLVLSLENADKKTGEIKKADVFTRRVIIPHKPVLKVGTVQEGLLVSLNEFGEINTKHIATISSKTEPEVIEELLSSGVVYKNPTTEGYETKDEYLSGNVKAKLVTAKKSAKKNPEYAPNVEALEKIIPADVPFHKIGVRIGSPWIPEDDYREFLGHLLDANPGSFNIIHRPSNGSWGVEFRGYSQRNYTNYGVQRRGYLGHELFEKIANHKPIVVYDTSEGPNGEAIKTVNEVLTAEAEEKAAIIKEAFSDWIWKDADRRVRLESYYNDHFNTTVIRQYDGSHLTFPGMNPAIVLRKSQINAIWRMIQEKTVLFAHAVGAGKTFTMIGSAMEMKRLGLIQKPMFAVLNSTISQFAKDFRTLYPAANILVADEKNFSSDKRESFLAKIATRDWDAIIITHSAFGKINVSPETYGDFVQEQIDDLEEFIRRVKSDQGKDAKVKDIENAVKKLKDKIKSKFDESKKDVTLTFEELGADMLFVDEAQEFKNLMYQTGIQKVAGLGSKEGSDKAEDLAIKISHLHSVNNGKGIAFATGTPILNTLSEAYSMMRYLQPNTLRELGIKHFDDWANQFGEIVSSLEVRPSGKGFRMNSRFSKIVNAKQLMTLVRQVWDVYTAKMLEDDGILRRGYELPRMLGEMPTAKMAPMYPALRNYIEILDKRYNAVRGKRPEKGKDNVLVVVGDGRKAAVDVRLVMPGGEDNKVTKLNMLIDGVHEIWKKSKADRSTQVVFFDLAKPKKSSESMSIEEEDDLESQDVSNTGFDPYEEMMKKWTASGIPAKEIVFINDAKNAKQRQAIFDKVKTGEVRILVGSRKKLGIGVNIQDKLLAAWHLDTPWRPGDLTQADGRIMRSGNENKQIAIFRMVTQESFDVYMWQTLESKAASQEKFMSGQMDVDVIEEEDNGFEMIKVKAANNPLLMEKSNLDVEVKRLQSLKRSYQMRKADEEKFLSTYENRVKASESDRKKAEARQASLPKERPTEGNKKFKITVNDKEYTDKKSAGAAILTNFEKVMRGANPAFMPKTGASIGSFLDHNLFAVDTLGSPGVKIYYGKDSIGVVSFEASPEGFVQAIVNRVFDSPQQAIDMENEYLSRLEKEKRHVDTEGVGEFKYSKELESMTAKQRELDKKLKAMAVQDETKSPDVEKQIQQETAPDTEDIFKNPEAGFISLSGPEKVDDEIGQVSFSDPEVERRFKASQGMTTKESIRKSLTDFWEFIVKSVRQYPELPNKEEFFPLKQILEKQNNSRKISQDRAIRALNAITANMGPKKLDLFTRKVILDDLVREAKAQRPIPFGYSEFDPETGEIIIRTELLEKDKANIDNLVEATPDVKEGIQRRQRLWDAVQRDLVRYKILKESQVKEDYFRHQVLEHAQLRATTGTGKKLKSPNPGYARQRKGSTYDINSSYLEAEMEVLSQAFQDIQTAKNIELLENGPLNIMKSLKDKAKSYNDSEMLKYFEEFIIKEKALGNPEYADMTAQKLYRKTLNFKQALGFSKLSKLASEGNLPTGDNEEYADLIQSWADEYNEGDDSEFESGHVFKYLNYLMKTKDESGAEAAALIFKGIAEKKQYFIQVLGEKIKTWEDFVPEGYTAWQPKEGRVFYSAYSVPQKVVNEVLQNVQPELEEFSITKQDLEKVMIAGALRKQLVVPEEVAKTLDNIYIAPPSNAIAEAAKFATSKWKQWILFNPRRAFKYNFQNFLGDADAVFAGNPKIFKNLKVAVDTLRDVFFKGQPMPDTMREFFERGGLDSSLTIQELPELKKLEIFDRFFSEAEAKNPQNLVSKALESYWNTVTQFTVFRESILRYAAYLHYREVFTDGGKEYAASNPNEIDAMESPLDKAAKVATELLGDYAAVSDLTKNMRQFLIPFASWLEVNAKRYYRLGRNAWNGSDGDGNGMARLGGVALKKGALGLAKWWMRAAAMTTLVALYNQLLHHDEESELSAYDQGRMHIVLWRTKDGRIVILRGQGAFSDILEWFGLDDSPQLWRDYFDGKASLVDIFGKIPFVTGKIGLKPAVQKIIRGISPLYKMPFEAMTGKTLPVFDDRPGKIEDPVRNILKGVSLEHEYDAIRGKASRGYFKSLIEAFVSVQDPKENAYRYIQSQKYEYLEKWKGRGGSSDYYSPRSILYREYKRALAYDDKEVAEKTLEKIKKIGTTAKQFKSSMEAANPLYGLSKVDKAEFTQKFLTQADRVKLEKALSYYQETYLKKPSSRSNAEAVRPAA